MPDIGLPENPWMLAALAIAAAALIGFVLSRLSASILRSPLRRTAVDERLYPLLDRSRYPLLIVLTLVFVADAAPLPPKAQAALHQILSTLSLLLAIVLASKGALRSEEHTSE